MSILQDQSYQNRDLRGIRFKGEYRNIDLRGSNLRDAHFENATLLNCDLRGCDLIGAHFQFKCGRGANNKLDDLMASLWLLWLLRMFDVSPQLATAIRAILPDRRRAELIFNSTVL